MSSLDSESRRDHEKQVKRRIREEFKKATRNRGSDRAFICKKDVEEIWSSNEDIEIILSSPRRWTGDELREIRRDFILTLSILFVINWSQMQEFRVLFYEFKDGEKRRTDNELPYKDELDLDFLEGHQDSFFEKQYMFKPVIIKQLENSYVQRVDGQLRLPFTEENHPLGCGGFGAVYKVKVAPHHLQTEDGNTNITVRRTCQARDFCWHNNFFQERVLAIKRFGATDQSAEDFQREVDNVQLLKESLSEKKRSVMLHVATIIHGGEFTILMPIADRWNLEIFLYRGFNRDKGTKKAELVYDFDRMFPRFNPPHRHTSVLYEMYALVDALHWLHKQLDVKDKPGLCCAHMDFKPSNILIGSDENSPAGRWMITDFGISVFKRLDDEDGSDGDDEDGDEDNNERQDTEGRQDVEVKTIGDFGLQLASKTQTIKTARTQEGTYQPPEARHSGQRVFVGRKSDIWSFGCVLL
jgi:hypothetical protein